MKLEILMRKLLSVLCILALSIDTIRDLYFDIRYTEPFWAKFTLTISGCFYLAAAAYLVLELFNVKLRYAYLWVYFFACGLVFKTLYFLINILANFH
jgi:hypothetical protein